MLAGAAAFTRAKFYSISLIGSALWTSSLTFAGYFTGKLFPQILQYKMLMMMGFILLASIPAIKIFIAKHHKVKN